MKFMKLMNTPSLKKNYKHNIEVLIDRIVVKKDIKQRLAESIEVGLTLSEGLVYVENLDTKKISNLFIKICLPSIRFFN